MFNPTLMRDLALKIRRFCRIRRCSVVSGAAPNDVAGNRVYNLYQHHRRELGLLARDSVLLSRTGFYLKLVGKKRQGGREVDVVMDEAGNVSVAGGQRTVMWELPARDFAFRQSLVRQYGRRVIDGDGPDVEIDGTMQSAWRQSNLIKRECKLLRSSQGHRYTWFPSGWSATGVVIEFPSGS